MLVKMYTNAIGVELLKHGYSAYVFDTKTFLNYTPIIISSHNLKFVREFVVDDFIGNVYEANGKISVVDEEYANCYSNLVT